MTLEAQLEAVLFVAGKPQSFKSLAQLFGVSGAQIQAAVEQLDKFYTEHHRGFRCVIASNTVLLTTSAAVSEIVAQQQLVEQKSELTKPSVETLSIIAYRGPLSKEELELIRGVNCSLILRNLMIRGLVEQVNESHAAIPEYGVTTEFLQHLGIANTTELPDYETLHDHALVQQVVQDAAEATSSDSVS